MSSATATMNSSSASLSLVPKSADDELLRARRLEVDDDLADGRHERRRARQQAGQQLGDAEGGRRGDDARDRRGGVAPERRRGRTRRSADWSRSCSWRASSPVRVTFACRGSAVRVVGPLMRAHARPSRRSIAIGQAERPAEHVVAQDLVRSARRPRARRRASTSACEKPGRDLLDVVRDEDDGRRARLAGEGREVAR